MPAAAEPHRARAALRLLALDTATEAMSLALVTPDGVVARDRPGGAAASASLVPALLALLDEAACDLGVLDAIAYGCGPGAFTGLRTACAVAQGLAYGAGKPVLAVDSLMLVAESVRELALAQGARTVWVAQDARMDEVYAAAYTWQGGSAGRWQTRVAPALYGAEALNTRWCEPATDPASAAVGSAFAVLGERLRPPAGPRLDVARGVGRARALATLAIAAWSDAALRDAAEALPVYLRDKVARTTTEREADRAAKGAA
jgi:tRNA threonylcarbamoyladenosine biosynthesis protein TsaB